MWLFDLYFNYTPSDLSPLHFLSNMILESKHILTFSISPASQMDKENLISLCFSDLPVFGEGLKKMLFVTSKESEKSFQWKVRLHDCNHPRYFTASWHPAFSMPLQLSLEGSCFMLYFMLQALLLSNKLIVLLQCR